MDFEKNEMFSVLNEEYILKHINEALEKAKSFK